MISGIKKIKGQFPEIGGMDLGMMWQIIDD